MTGEPQDERASTAGPARGSTARALLLSLATLAGGATLAAIPAATVAISARLFTTDEQGWIAVAVLAATFVGQVVTAALVEAPLGSADTERRVAVPRWLTIATIVATIAVMVSPPSAVLLIVALPVMLTGLETGRQVSVAERLDLRELAASAFVGVGVLAGVTAGILDQWWALIPLAAGVAGASIARGLPVAHTPSRAHPIVRRWIIADTALVGAVIPVLNGSILALLGPNDAVLFTAVSTASGLLAIPLNFMRARLLKEHSTLDILASAGAVVAGFVALLILHFTGLLELLFGPVWTVQTATTALIVACAWRAASLVSSLPFAALRRIGLARLVALLRAGGAALNFVLGTGGLIIGSAFGDGGGLVGAFLGLLLAELGVALVYWVALRRVHRAAH